MSIGTHQQIPTSFFIFSFFLSTVSGEQATKDCLEEEQGVSNLSHSTKKPFLTLLNLFQSATKTN